jgi:hypothetical protein
MEVLDYILIIFEFQLHNSFNHLTTIQEYLFLDVNRT